MSEAGLYSIGTVERDTGIGRDTLRVWERRYGFPTPLRNEKGERSYTEWQLRRLQRIRRLMDQGLRPGKLLPLSEAELNELEARLQPATPSRPSGIERDILDAIRTANAERIEQLLQEQYQQQGMQAFILHTVMPLLKTVGQLWAGGQLQIYQEHFLSDRLGRFINAEISKLPRATAKPRLLLATLPGEEHTLGLLMLDAILAARGMACVNLGSEVPMDQIGQAAQQFKADIVGLTFSGSYPYAHIRAELQELREHLPDKVQVWAGGEGVRRLRKLPDGVHKFTSLERLPL